MTAIPNTPLTARLRAIWQAMQELTSDDIPFEDWYTSCDVGCGSVNGCAVAAVLFDRARRHWPDFFSPTDTPAVQVWGELIDKRIPLVTPDVIEQAVDDVALMQAYPGGPAPFLRAAERIMESGVA